MVEGEAQYLHQFQPQFPLPLHRKRTRGDNGPGPGVLPGPDLEQDVRQVSSQVVEYPVHLGLAATGIELIQQGLVGCYPHHLGLDGGLFALEREQGIQFRFQAGPIIRGPGFAPGHRRLGRGKHQFFHQLCGHRIGVHKAVSYLPQVGLLPGVQGGGLRLGLQDQFLQAVGGLQVVHHHTELRQHAGPGGRRPRGHHGFLVPVEDAHGVIEGGDFFLARFQLQVGLHRGSPSGWFSASG